MPFDQFTSNVPTPGQLTVPSDTQSIAPLAAAGISAGTGMLNSLFQGISNRRQNKRMVDFWNMNNEYNHPAAQMARLREAGLNPALMYGQGTTGNSSAPVKDAGTAPANLGDPIGAYQNTKLQNAQYDNLRAQNTAILNDAALKAASTIKALNEAKIKSSQGKILSRTMEDQISSIISESSMKLNESRMTAQRFMLNRIEDREMPALNKKAKAALAASFDKVTQESSNAEKLGALRDLEVKLKAMNLDWYERNAYTAMFAKILGISLFK
jgi:hypothetical protein